ncbi:sucrase ferredoxin [Nocardioides maradonensis]
MPEPAFRCAAASLGRDEPVAGTATHVRTWLLLEHAGPWGAKALRDARLPEGLGSRLQRLAAEHTAKVLLIRRPRARRDPERLTVIAAYADPVAPRLERGTVGDLREVFDLDLGGLREGRGSGLEPADGSVLAVCTNGRHDACCAERGRPVALALGAAHPEPTWEVSHVGGDRFAGNLVALPHGLYYGRLDEESALRVAGAHLAGQIDLEHLRGRSSYAMPVQAAEIALRRRLGLVGIDDVRLVRVSRGGAATFTRFDVGKATYDVVVRTLPGAAERLTCSAQAPRPVPRHQLVELFRSA